MYAVPYMYKKCLCVGVSVSFLTGSKFSNWATDQSATVLRFSYILSVDFTCYTVHDMDTLYALTLVNDPVTDDKKVCILPTGKCRSVAV